MTVLSALIWGIKEGVTSFLMSSGLILLCTSSQMATMDYAEIKVEQKYHRHIIGKGGASGEYTIISVIGLASIFI